MKIIKFNEYFSLNENDSTDDKETAYELFSEYVEENDLDNLLLRKEGEKVDTKKAVDTILAYYDENSDNFSYISNMKTIESELENIINKVLGNDTDLNENFENEEEEEVAEIKYNKLTSDGTELATDILKNLISKIVDNKLKIKEGKKRFGRYVLESNANEEGYITNVYVLDSIQRKVYIGTIENDNIDDSHLCKNSTVDKFVYHGKHLK
jgi:hypothetical protein